MAILSHSPKLLRGALLGYDQHNPIASTIIFQYNPNEVSRNLNAQAAGEDADRKEVLRLKGAPIETLKLNITLDATDQLNSDNKIASAMGIYPQLSALEMLIYPKSATVIENTALLTMGTLEIIPSDAPLILLVWGVRRVVPVRITDFSISEEAYDPSLNPIRAEVSLGLRVLTYDDFPATHPGYYAFLAHQMVKETMATINSLNAAGSINPNVLAQAI